MSRKGISSEVMVIIFLIAALAGFVVLWLLWSAKGKGLLEMLSNLFLFD